MNATSRYVSIALFAAVAVGAGCTKQQAAEPAPAKASAPLKADVKPGEKPSVVFDTSMGAFTMELDPEKAPASVKNFLQYVDDGFYDGTIFHRVIPGFVVQGGGFSPDLEKKPTRGPVVNEANNGLKNDTGSVAMARTSDPNSATSQFYVNLRDNPALDHRDMSQAGMGYTVFGHVTEGMDVVQSIASVPRGQQKGMGDVPTEPVVIKSARRR